jgi:predicted nucleic acid-binding protein
MPATPKVIIDTGIIVEHLMGTVSPSVLRRALSKMLCYTTVVQAAELFAMAGSERERGAVQDALAPLKILGLNARSAPHLGSLMRSSGIADRTIALIAVMSLESRLPILTGRAGEFSGVRGLCCVSPRLITTRATGREILQAARRRT